MANESSIMEWYLSIVLGIAYGCIIMMVLIYSYRIIAICRRYLCGKKTEISRHNKVRFRIETHSSTATMTTSVGTTIGPSTTRISYTYHADYSFCDLFRKFYDSDICVLPILVETVFLQYIGLPFYYGPFKIKQDITKSTYEKYMRGNYPSYINIRYDSKYQSNCNIIENESIFLYIMNGFGYVLLLVTFVFVCILLYYLCMYVLTANLENDIVLLCMVFILMVFVTSITTICCCIKAKDSCTSVNLYYLNKHLFSHLKCEGSGIDPIYPIQTISQIPLKQSRVSIELTPRIINYDENINHESQSYEIEHKNNFQDLASLPMDETTENNNLKGSHRAFLADSNNITFQLNANNNMPVKFQLNDNNNDIICDSYSIIFDVLLNNGFDKIYIKRGLTVYSKYYGNKYDITIIREIIYRLGIKDKLKELKAIQNLFQSRDAVEDILLKLNFSVAYITTTLTMYQIMAEMTEMAENIYDLELVTEMIMRLRAKDRERGELYENKQIKKQIKKQIEIKKQQMKQNQLQPPQNMIVVANVNENERDHEMELNQHTHVQNTRYIKQYNYKYYK